MKKLKKCSSRSTWKKKRRVLGIHRAVFTAPFERHSDSQTRPVARATPRDIHIAPFSFPLLISWLSITALLLQYTAPETGTSRGCSFFRKMLLVATIV